MNKKFYTKIEFYLVLLYALLTGAFIYFSFKMNVIPAKYFTTIIIVLVALFALLSYLQLSKKMLKGLRALGKVMIVILCLLLAMGNWYMYSTYNTLSKVTSTKKDVDVVSVVVLKESPLKSLKDIDKQLVCHTIFHDQTLEKHVMTDLKKEMGSKPKTKIFGSYKDLTDALYKKDIQVMLLNESSRGIVEETHPNFTEETRILKSFEYEKETKDIAKEVDVASDAFNVYITGMDTYGMITTASRSDVNLIMTINPTTHQILMTGIPRDYYIPQTCQGNQLDKLTHTGIFGVDCTVESMENLLDIDLNYYVRVNFSSLIDVVDSIGGIDVDSPYAFETGNASIQVGMNHLNGEQALSFVRERYSLPGGDRDRNRNQMRVLSAIINKAISPSIIMNYPDLIAALSNSFQTNMPQKDMTSFIKNQINEMSSWDIKQIQLYGYGETNWSPANGFNSYVMRPNEDSVANASKLIKQVHQGKVITNEQIEEQNSIR